MRMFRAQHPLVLLMYVSIVLILLTSLHPLLVLYAFIGGVVYLALVQSVMYVLRELVYYSAVTVLMTVMYASMAHNGVTPLFFYNDHPVTLEACIRGVMLGATVTTAVIWLKAFTYTMQTNHFLFLFTKVHPRLGIAMSMCFRFFPYYRELWQEHRRAQQGIHYFQTASRFDRGGRWLALQLHTLVQAGEAVFWKPAVMMSKGYQKKRTQYELFRWRRLDTVLTLVSSGTLLLVVSQWQSWQYEYYPALMDVHVTAVDLVLLAFFLVPAMIEGKEVIKWHYLQSKI